MSCLISPSYSAFLSGKGLYLPTRERERERDTKRLDRVNSSKFRRGEGKFNFMEQKNDDCILDPISLAMLQGLVQRKEERDSVQ